MKKSLKAFVVGTALFGIFFSPQIAEATYTVQKGDTLFKIAKTHNTTIEQLKQLNQLTSDMIYVDQILITPSTAKQVATNQETLQEVTLHTVVKGETLLKIAAKYNTTALQLRQHNNLTSNAIKIGQKLVIYSALETTATQAVSEKNATTVQNTADAWIEKHLNSEKEAPTTISKASEAFYKEVLQIAEQAIGIPYVYGGSTLEGFDCSGFVSYVYNQAGMKLERKSSLQYFELDTTKVKAPVPGDLVFFKNTNIPTISHMGIYIGNDQFIHAGSKGITISSIHEKYWQERFVAYKRLVTVQ